MNRLDELPRCQDCGATMTSTDTYTLLCSDCRPRKPPPGPGPQTRRRRDDMERTRVMRAQGFTERQIAQALGVDITTVRARLRRARQRGMATQKGA